MEFPPTPFPESGCSEIPVTVLSSVLTTATEKHFFCQTPFHQQFTGFFHKKAAATGKFNPVIHYGMDCIRRRWNFFPPVARTQSPGWLPVPIRDRKW
jgi:hypothetical protein